MRIKLLREYINEHPLLAMFLMGLLLTAVSIIWIAGWEWRYVFLGSGIILMIIAIATGASEA